MKEQYAEAEHMARRAVSLDQSSASGMFVLGVSLVLGRKFTPEAESNLKRAADEIAQASFWLAVGLIGKGDLKTARDQLRTYLATGDKTANDSAQTLLQRLEVVDKSAQ